MMFKIVTECFYFPCFGCIAAAAVTSLYTHFGACRCSGYCPLAEVMTKRIHIAVYIAVAAETACVCREALFRTGRCGSFTLISVQYFYAKSIIRADSRIHQIYFVDSAHIYIELRKHAAVSSYRSCAIGIL